MFTSVEYNFFLYWDKNSNEEFLSRNVWSVVTSSMHVLLNSYSTVAHNASRPNIHMLTLVPILNCLLFYSSPPPPIYPRASTHPFAFSFHRDHTFSFQMCRGIILNEVAADSITPYAEPSPSATYTCLWCWWFVYHSSLSLLSDQHAKWDRLKKQPAVTGRSYSRCPLDSLAAVCCASCW